MAGTCLDCGARVLSRAHRCPPCRARHRDVQIERCHARGAHYDMSPDAIERRYAAALAEIKAASRRVDPWQQRAGYTVSEGPEAFAPLAGELPSYREVVRTRRDRSTPAVWNGRPAR